MAGDTSTTEKIPTTEEKALAAVSDESSLTGQETEAERRQPPVIFCDLAGSTELFIPYDPEALRDIIRRYRTTATSVIEHYDGHITH